MNRAGGPIDELLAEQTTYYRERAAEYDATSRPTDDPFGGVEAEIEADLRRLRPVHRAIELGAGTGAFTRILADVARYTIAVDVSPEMLEINRSRTPAANVDRVVADVFDWKSPQPVDLVVFGFLLSHIPADRFEAFWAAVGQMLVPGGRVFVADETEHGLWSEESVTGAGDEVVYRTLNNGRRFRIVKVLWDPVELAGRLAELGWSAALRRHDPFYWGTLIRR